MARVPTTLQGRGAIAWSLARWAKGYRYLTGSSGGGTRQGWGPGLMIRAGAWERRSVEGVHIDRAVEWLRAGPPSRLSVRWAMPLAVRRWDRGAFAPPR